jgi:hypothetical protein
VNSFFVIVGTEEKKQFTILVNSNTRLTVGSNGVLIKVNIPKGLGEIVIEGKKVEEIGTINEMDVEEGNVLSFRLCPLMDLILDRDSISV